MKILRDFVIVKVPSVFQDETIYKGLNGKAILMNVLHRPEHHLRIKGVVVSTPFSLGTFPILQDNSTEYPQPYEDSPQAYKRMNDIEMEVQDGDMVYFHYNCLKPVRADMRGFNQFFMGAEQEMVGKELKTFYYFRVKYSLIFAAVRYVKTNQTMPDFDWNREAELRPFKSIILQEHEQPRQDDRYMLGDAIYRKEIQMIGSYVLVEANKETWEDISIPIPETVNGQPMFNRDGTVRMKPKDQWLVTKSAPKNRYLQGWVRHVGSPLKGDDQEVQVGMYVFFKQHTNTVLLFEGKEYYRMLQRYINAYQTTAIC